MGNVDGFICGQECAVYRVNMGIAGRVKDGENKVKPDEEAKG
jgi:hypothetical protein